MTQPGPKRFWAGSRARAAVCAKQPLQDRAALSWHFGGPSWTEAAWTGWAAPALWLACPVPCSIRRRRGRWVGTFLVPTPPGGCGAQRRARAAPLGAGTGPARSHAQPPFGGEHGEHGEDPPLARSEHRGTRTVPARTVWARKLSTRSRAYAGLGLLLGFDF